MFEVLRTWARCKKSAYIFHFSLDRSPSTKASPAMRSAPACYWGSLGAIRAQHLKKRSEESNGMDNEADETTAVRCYASIFCCCYMTAFLLFVATLHCCYLYTFYCMFTQAGMQKKISGLFWIVCNATRGRRIRTIWKLHA